MGGPRIDKVERTSQASQFSEEFLKILQGQLSGAFGTGVGPQQREAGTAIRQFVKSLQGQVAGGPSESLQRLLTGVEAGSLRRTEEGAGNIREQFGITGSRFGTPLAMGEARFRAERGEGLDRTLGQLGEQGRQFDIGQLLAGIQQLFGQGQANIDLFARFAELGILPEEIIAGPGIGQQLLAGGLQAGAAFAGRPPGVGGFAPPGGPPSGPGGPGSPTPGFFG